MASRSKKDRSRSSKKGWETRRKNNPLKWGKRVIAKKQAVTREIKEAAEIKQFMVNVIETDIEYIKAEKAFQEVKEKKVKLQTFGTPKPERWMVNLLKAMSQFIEDKDANEDSATIKKSYDKWLRLKTKAKARLGHDEGDKTFHNLIALYGSNLHLPMEGKFSVQRFIDSP
jgi:hypothetical protein